MCSPGSYRPLRRDRTCAATRGRGLCAGGGVTVTGLLALPSRRDEAWRWSRHLALPELAHARHRQSVTAATHIHRFGGPPLVFAAGVLDDTASVLGPVSDWPSGPATL